MEENGLLSVALKIVFDRTIDKFTLHEKVLEGNSSSDFSKWSRVIGTTLKDAMNEATCNLKLTLSLHTGKMDLRKEMEVSEKQKQENIHSQIEWEKKVLDNYKSKFSTMNQALNGKICEFKDRLDMQAESVSKNFVYCENQEKSRVKTFNEKFRLEQEEWGNKVSILEREIELENYRNAEEKKQLCAEIDKLTLAVSTIRTNWEQFSNALIQEKKEILRRREAIKPQINVVSEELIKRQLVVNQDQQGKQLAEEANLAFMKLSMVVIRIQSWWRGLLARRDYARYKIACKKKQRTKPSQQKQVVPLSKHLTHTNFDGNR